MNSYIRKPNTVQRESSWLSANKPSWKYIETQLLLFIGEIDDFMQIEFSDHKVYFVLSIKIDCLLLEKCGDIKLSAAVACVFKESHSKRCEHLINQSAILT